MRTSDPKVCGTPKLRSKAVRSGYLERKRTRTGQVPFLRPGAVNLLLACGRVAKNLGLRLPFASLPV
jgi:hypothetical protein